MSKPSLDEAMRAEETLWAYSLLLVVNRTNTVSHQAGFVRATSKAEALGKVELAAERIFPGEKGYIRDVALTIYEERFVITTPEDVCLVSR